MCVSGIVPRSADHVVHDPQSPKVLGLSWLETTSRPVTEG